jgi:SAM-dependent methyltransferase
MAHIQQLQFVKSVSKYIRNDYSNLKILEIGSYDVNGEVRKYFEKSDYVGVDLTDGPGVDIVCGGDQLDHPDQSYDLSISCECFEHNPNWVETFENMWRMTKNGGVVFFTCATTGRPEHGTTRTTPTASPGTQSLGWDYYKNLTKDDFIEKFQFNELFQSHFFMTNTYSCDLYFVGIKKSDKQIFDFKISELEVVCAQHQDQIQKRKKSEKLIPKPFRPIFRKIHKFFVKNSVHNDLIDRA